MIFAIATTTLNKEVKHKLKTGQYSREEATFIYLEYLKLKKQRESGMKVAGISMALIWGLMIILPLLSGRDLVLPLSVYFLLLILLAGIALFVYYLTFGIFKQYQNNNECLNYLFIILRLVFLNSRFIAQ